MHSKLLAIKASLLSANTVFKFKAIFLAQHLSNLFICLHCSDPRYLNVPGYVLQGPSPLSLFLYSPCWKSPTYGHFSAPPFFQRPVLSGNSFTLQERVNIVFSCPQAPQSAFLHHFSGCLLLLPTRNFARAAAALNSASCDAIQCQPDQNVLGHVLEL